MKYISVDRVVSADLHTVWPIVSDIGNYADYAPNIDQSKVISGNGKGMVRECSAIKQGRWSEVCTDWQDHSHFNFLVNTEADDYPFPLSYLAGKWSVNTVGVNQTLLRMDFEFEFKNWMVGLVGFPFMKRQFLAICEELLDNWERDILATG